MPQPYKLEIFDRDYRYRDRAALTLTNIAEDYLTLQKTTIQVAGIHAQKGDYAHITDMSGDVLFQGIVEDVNITCQGYKLSLLPLLALLDVPVQYDRSRLQDGTLEDFIASIITSTYITNQDSLQNIPGLKVQITSSTQNARLNLKSNVHEFWDIATKALTLYSVIIKARLEPQEKQIIFTVGKAAQSLTIESELANCIHKNFVLTDTYGNTNKATYINKEDEVQRITYYLHTDGSVSIANINRVTPVFFTVEYIEGAAEDFAEEALNRATEQLTPQVYKQLIELTYAENDRMLQPTTLHIGALADIHYKDTVYRSVLTGYEKTGGKITLVFGTIRMELTKKLTMERRAKSAD